MIEGVTEGYKKVLEVIGVGFRADAQGQILTLSVGHSHPIVFQIPDEIKVTAETAKGKRSEERRVGKECRSRWWTYHLKKKTCNNERKSYVVDVYVNVSYVL